MKKVGLFIIIFCYVLQNVKCILASEQKELVKQATVLFTFISKTTGIDCKLEDANYNEVVAQKIVAQLEDTMNIKDYNEQYKVLRAAKKNVGKFKKDPFIYEHSEVLSNIFDEMSYRIKAEHPDQVKAEKSVVFSQMESFISNCDIDEVTNRSNIDGVFGYSGIEDELSKVKSNIESYEELKAENKILKNQDQNNQRRLQEVMEREITLKLENEKMKERIRELEEQHGNAKSFDNLHNLYKQITGLYQKLLKSKDDFESIIKLRKQIEKEENNEEK